MKESFENKHKNKIKTIGKILCCVLLFETLGYMFIGDYAHATFVLLNAFFVVYAFDLNFKFFD